MANEANEAPELTLRQKTENILSTMPETVAPEVAVMIGLVKLLLEEMDRSELSTLKDTVATQRVVTDKLASDNKRLRNRVYDLEDRLYDLEEKTDNIEQHGRNINLILRGIPEGPEENELDEDGKPIQENTTKKFVDVINSKFETSQQLKMTDIARSHRLGERRSNKKKPRPIIARFALETKKIAVYKNKRKLKSSGFTLAENLTEHRQELYDKACEVMNYKNVWTMEGRVHAIHARKRIHIRNFNDIPGYEEGDEPLF